MMGVRGRERDEIGIRNPEFEGPVEHPAGDTQQQLYAQFFSSSQESGLGWCQETKETSENTYGRGFGHIRAYNTIIWLGLGVHA